MTWFPDLGPIDYFHSLPSSRLRAVGWLEREHAFERGPVDADFIERLGELLQEPWKLPGSLFLGSHNCRICGVEDYGWSTTSLDPLIANGTYNLFVPGEECVYVAPELILHYVQAHRYAPPESFVRAVLSCDLPGTQEYLRRLDEASGGQL